MERDFLGLATNSSSPSIIKQETNDACNDSALAQRGAGSLWYFPDSVLDSPLVGSSKSRTEEKPMRSFYDPAQSPRLGTASTKPDYNQRNIISKQSGSQVALVSSSMKQSDLYHPEGFKLHSLSNNQNKTTSAMSYPVLQSHPFPVEQHMSRLTSNSLSLGRVPPVSPTFTDTRSSSKPLTAPAQMTIFYAGSVNIYDNIAPEKAQAIMLLAGKGMTSTLASVDASTQLLAPHTKPSKHDIVCIGNPSRTSSSPGLVSHVSRFSTITSQCEGVSSQRTLTASRQHPEPSQAVYSQRPSVGYSIPGPVPQARKASLARFLERRKERVTNSRPYPVELKLSERERIMSSSSDSLSFTLGSPI